VVSAEAVIGQVVRLQRTKSSDYRQIYTSQEEAAGADAASWLPLQECDGGEGER
jgi:hypothetical protein